jgi:hypothetical protein
MKSATAEELSSAADLAKLGEITYPVDSRTDGFRSLSDICPVCVFPSHVLK